MLNVFFNCVTPDNISGDYYSEPKLIMTQEITNYPVVLCFSGHDATSGAGIAADIETLRALKCHPSAVVTAITVQDTRDVQKFVPVDAPLVVEQARAIFADIQVAVIKIGLIGSVDNLGAICALLREYPAIPVVFDPILRAGGGTLLADRALTHAISELLLPLTTIITPNLDEARALAPHFNSVDDCAAAILAHGTRYVVITGADVPTATVINTFYGADNSRESFSWPRLSQTYHGSGCTLAAGIAGFFAHNFAPLPAVIAAQEFTWQALRRGYRIGKGQFIPGRI